MKLLILLLYGNKLIMHDIGNGLLVRHWEEETNTGHDFKWYLIYTHESICNFQLEKKKQTGKPFLKKFQINILMF